MRMKPEHSDRLLEMLQVQFSTPRSELIMARRVAQYIHGERKFFRAFYDVEIPKAEAGLPFTASRLKMLKEARREASKAHRATLEDVGVWLYHNDCSLTAKYGFDGICDILNVNPAHRPEALDCMEDKGRAISAIAFIAGIEDSASIRSGRNQPDFKDGPLFNAYMEVMMKTMRENPGAMPDPTAPGGPLYGLPTYTRRPDGTMARNKPTLTVHSPDGSSKVIKGKQGVNHG